MPNRPEGVVKPRDRRSGTPDAPGRAARDSGPSILVVEDDADERRAIASALDPWKDSVRYAPSAAAAIAAIAADEPDVVLLDLGLPDGDGLDLLRRLRRTSGATVIVHSARSSEAEKVALLDAGADDYVLKGVGAEELRARLRAHLRRADIDQLGAGPGLVQIGDLRIDVQRQRASRDGGEISLTPTEWALVRALMLNAGRTLTHDALWEQVWGRQFGDASLHLRVHITHLRRKLERTPAMPVLIVTEPGVGYRIELS